MKTPKDSERGQEPLADNVFAAEAILKSRRKRGKIEYYIKWRGWSAKHNTWEPAQNILDNRLIQEFNRRKVQKSKEKSSTVRSKVGTASEPSSSGSRAGVAPIVPPLFIKIVPAGLELEENSSESSTPPKLSPQGRPDSAASSGSSVWEADVSHPHKKIVVADQFNFNRQTVTDVTVKNRTVTFVEL